MHCPICYTYFSVLLNFAVYFLITRRLGRFTVISRNEAYLAPVMLIQSGMRVPENTGEGLSGSIRSDSELYDQCLHVSCGCNFASAEILAYIVSTNGLKRGH